MIELPTTAFLLAAMGALILVAVLFSRAVDRLGVPVVLLFLILGMLGGSEGIGGLAFDDYTLAVRLGTAALVLILFDGGLNTSVEAVRRVLAPSAVLATVGVALTAGIVAVCARLIGLPWSEAMLLGAVVSSTDAAAVFAVLRGGRLQLRPRLGQTIEVESCINDPMAVILTTSIIAYLRAGQDVSLGQLLIDVPVQLVVGASIGIVLGWLGAWILRRARIATVGLYPAMTLALALLSFGVATLSYGSGFLAVYATALVLGNATLPYRSGLTRVHDALAWLSQITMFLMLGLLVFPSQLLPVVGMGLAISLLLTLVARPIAVIVSLLPFRYRAAEVAYVSWVGLRGAVPIILATFPVLAQVEGAGRVFNLVFFVVVVSSIVPGALLRVVSRWLRLSIPETPSPPAVLEINTSFPMKGELRSFYIHPSVAVCGAKLSEIDFPAGAAIVLIVRGHDLLAARGRTVLQAGDHVYVFARMEDRPYIELLFGRPEAG